MSFPLFASLSIFYFLFSSLTLATSHPTSKNFIKCLAKNSNASTPVSNIVYSPDNSSFSSIWEFSIQNRVFLSSTTRKPQFIVTPLNESHIQAAVICSKEYSLSIRVRSGGHDYEGQSYLSAKPFVIIDLVKFEKIDVNIADNTAWVQAGATVGQIYYRIAEKSKTLAFPAGVCTTLGLGGYIGGGGLGILWRKYGLAADNVLDAYFIDVNGKLLDRKSMGEDLFWAIRGGGGSSFGIIAAWKIRLVSVPSVVTFFRVPRTLEQGVTDLFYKWQTSAPKFPEDIQVQAIVVPVISKDTRTISITFQSLFLGTIKELLPLMESIFPELGVEAKDCSEMSWINSTLALNGLSGTPVEVLLNRSQSSKQFFKAKSDFVQEAISIPDLTSIGNKILEEDISPRLIIEPMGGIMDEIPETAIPFPHREGNLYSIQYFMAWENGSESTKYLDAVNRIYDYMTPFVSKSPRASYLNYKDLDLGTNKDINTCYSEAKVWGEKYFKGNFARLAFVKSRVDPENFFWDEQSIPPFCSKGKKGKIDL